MKRTLVFVALLVAAVALFFVLRADESGPDPVRGADEATSESTAASESTLAAADAATERTSVVEAADTATADSDATELAVAAPTVDASQLARIRGVVVLHDGTPAAGARVTVDGSNHSTERTQLHGAPKTKWVDVEATTNADGSFDVTFDPPRAYEFTLEVAAAWAPRINLPWDEILPGSSIDVGTLELPLGGQVEGRIVRPDGSPAGGTWEAAATDSLYGPLREFHEDVALVKVEPSDTSFHFDGLAPGTVEIMVAAALIDAPEPQQVEVVAGRTTTVTFVYAGPPADRRLALLFTDGSSRTFGPPSPECVHLRSTRGEALTTGLTAVRSREHFQFDDLEPGEYVIAVDDPRFAPFESEPLATGQQHALSLTGNVALTLCVTGDGHVIEGARFDVRSVARERRSEARHGRVKPASNDMPGEYVFTTTPDAQVWSVIAPNFAAREVEFAAGFEPHSQQRVEVALEPVVGIAGRVLDVSGEPLAGVTVTAFVSEGEPPTDPMARQDWFGRIQQKPVLRALSAADGSFTVGPLTEPAYDLVTDHSPAICGRAFGVAAGRDDVELVLAPHGSLSGRITPDFRGRADVSIGLVGGTPVERLPIHLVVRHRYGTPIEVAADGTFRADFQPVGAHTLTLSTEKFEFSMGDGRMSSGGQPLTSVPYTIIAGTTTEIVVDVSNAVPRAARIHVDETSGSSTRLRVVGLKLHHFERDDSEHWYIKAQGEVGEDGWADVWPIASGSWRFELRPYDAPWGWPIGDEVEVDATTDLERRVVIELVRARVAFVDPSGARIPNCHFVFPLDGTSSSQQADESGELELEMPPGTYALEPDHEVPDSNGTLRPVQPIELVWTRDGPAEPVIVLRPVE